MKVSFSILSVVGLLAFSFTAANATPIGFKTPEGWTKEKPKSRMRKAQYKVKRSKGDAEDAEVVIYFFGAMGGGSVDSNIKRWAAQFKKGKDDPAAKKSEKRCGGHDVIIYDQQGSYHPPQFRPGPKPKAKPNSRMLGAIIQTGEGNYFVKFIGPKATVAANLKKFDAFLESVTGVAKIEKKPEPKATPKPESKPASRPGR